MWLIAGLGNPGREYEDTRHNVGFLVVDVLARRHTAAFAVKFKAEVAQARVGKDSVVLMKPQTFMNLSGQAVQPAMAFFKVPVDNVIVVHDDLDLELGQIKLKRGGGAGGHNGLKSIDAQIGPNYLRVRAGIGHPGERGRVVGHVLKQFAKDERVLADELVERCADAVEQLITHGLEKAQMEFHGAASKGAKRES